MKKNETFALPIMITASWLSLMPPMSTAATPAKADMGSYMQALQSKLKWMPPANCKASKVTVHFTINTDGSVKDIKVPVSSGDQALDQSAIAAIQKAAPFAPLFDKSSPLTVNFTFNCGSTTASGVDMKAYNEELWKKIQKSWWVPKRLLFFKATLKLAINADGSLADVSLLKSSGDKNADKLAIIAIKRAAPFDKLPEGVSAPYRLSYNLGFENNHDPYFNIWNGEKINEGQSYTTGGGVKMTIKDETTAKDKELHNRKEEALIRMADLDEAIQKEKTTAGAESAGLAPLLLEYAACQRVLEDHSASLEKLKEALAVCRAHPDQPGPLDNALFALGQAEYSLGHTAEAERELKEAIEIRENKLSIKDKQLKEMLETMGRLLYKQSRSQEADQYYSRAKAIIGN